MKKEKKDKYNLRKTILNEVQIELDFKKSRFIGFSYHCFSKKEAEEKIKRHKEKYADATHNCYAYIVNDNITIYDDDGEPALTAGMPILNVIKHEEYLFTLVIVTRYFGGTLLGTGGLVKAYTETAKEVLNASGVAGIGQGYEYLVSTTYKDYDNLKRYLEKNDIIVKDSKFEENIRFRFESLDKNIIEDMVGTTGADLKLIEKNEKIILKKDIDYVLETLED